MFLLPLGSNDPGYGGADCLSATALLPPSRKSNNDRHRVWSVARVLCSCV